MDADIALPGSPCHSICEPSQSPLPPLSRCPSEQGSAFPSRCPSPEFEPDPEKDPEEGPDEPEGVTIKRLERFELR